MPVALVHGDARALPLADRSVNCIVTSPPYWQLRSYGGPHELGSEPVHDCGGWVTGDNCGECFVCHMRQAAREMWRVLRDDGTLWLNIGDTYSQAGKGGGGKWGAGQTDARNGRRAWADVRRGSRRAPGLAPKNLCLVPQRLALALQADGWIVRSQVIWHKTNAQPSSVKDRPTPDHEPIWLLAKARHYYYDADAVRERSIDRAHPGALRNRRTVWTSAVSSYKGAHFATMPEAIVEPCLLAGCPPKGVVLDPFAGSGTVGQAAIKHGRHAVLVDQNREYLEVCAAARTRGVQVELLTGVA